LISEDDMRKQLTSPDPNEKDDKKSQKFQQIKNIEIDAVLGDIDKAIQPKAQEQKQESCICC